MLLNGTVIQRVLINAFLRRNKLNISSSDFSVTLSGVEMKKDRIENYKARILDANSIH